MHYRLSVVINLSQCQLAPLTNGASWYLFSIISPTNQLAVTDMATVGRRHWRIKRQLNNRQTVGVWWSGTGCLFTKWQNHAYDGRILAPFGS